MGTITFSPQNFSVRKTKLIKYSIYFIFYTVLFKDTLSGYPFNLNISIRYIDDIVVVLLYILFFSDLLKSKAYKHTNYFIYFFILFLFSHIIQSIYFKDFHIIGKFMLFIRDNFWYFPTLYFIQKYKMFDFSLNLLIKFAKLQVFFILLSVVYHFITTGSLLWEDNINGTLGSHSSHILSYSLILLIPALIYTKKYLLIFLIAISILLASARSVIFFATTSFALLYILNNFKVKAIIALLFTASLLIYPVYLFVNKNFNATLNPTLLFSQQQSNLSEGSGAARLSFLLYSANKLNSLERIIFGYGSGSYSSRTAVTLEGSEYKKLNNFFRFQNEFISGGSSYNAWLVEHGIIVFALILSLFLFPIFIFKRYWYVSGTFLTFFLGLGVQKLMESYAPSLMFWICLSFCILLKSQANESVKTEASV